MIIQDSRDIRVSLYEIFFSKNSPIMKDNMSPGGSEGANFLIYLYYKLNDGNYYYNY